MILGHRSTVDTVIVPSTIQEEYANFTVTLENNTAIQLLLHGTILYTLTNFSIMYLSII